jgi:WD40 repeat protein
MLVLPHDPDSFDIGIFSFSQRPMDGLGAFNAFPSPSSSLASLPQFASSPPPPVPSSYSFPHSHTPSGLERVAYVSLDDPPKRAAVPHHPQNGDSGLMDVPGGDCKSDVSLVESFSLEVKSVPHIGKRLCIRHKRMVDLGVLADLQKVCLPRQLSAALPILCSAVAENALSQSIEDLPLGDQQAVNSIWSLFSSSRAARRTLILRGILSICCPSQLSFLSEQLKAECRIDPFSILPRELSLKIMGSLDAFSLGRAAQVSRHWRTLADDDLLWRTMCEQHIERKCEKCGWGLPLLEKRRRAARAGLNALTRPQPSTLANTNPASTGIPGPSSHLVRPQHFETTEPRPSKRARAVEVCSDDSDADPSVSAAAYASPLLSSSPAPSATRPWKSVYCERLAIERNWRHGTCSVSVLSGHTDAVTCLQVDESLSHPPFPVLMTGSWDRTVRIWNLETGECLKVLTGHTRGIRAIRFDSAKLITGGMDGTIRIWNWRTGDCIRVLEGHRDAVLSLCFDKQVLCSGSADATIKVWLSLVTSIGSFATVADLLALNILGLGFYDGRMFHAPRAYRVDKWVRLFWRGFSRTHIDTTVQTVSLFGPRMPKVARQIATARGHRQLLPFPTRHPSTCSVPLTTGQFACGTSTAGNASVCSRGT